MKLILSPQRRDDTVVYAKKGESLIVNGETFDFSRLNEGDTLPYSAIRSEWFIGPVERVNGELILTVWLPNPWNYSKEQAFPEPIYALFDGIIDLPKPRPDAQARPIVPVESTDKGLEVITNEQH